LHAKLLHAHGAVALVRLALVIVVVFGFGLLFGLEGCSSKPAGSDMMAKVNGRKIPRSEVERYYNSQVTASPERPSQEQADALRLNILDKLIETEILTQRAEKDGLIATDDEVERKLSEFQSGYSPDNFQKLLNERHMTVADLRQEFRRSITLDKVVNKEITSKIDIKDADVAAYYNAHKAEFNLIEPQYHLARILVTNGPTPQARNLKGSKAQNEEEARKKIQEILNRLDSGEDFGTLAMNLSEDPDTAMNGGDLGSIPESGLKNTDPASREAVLKLKPGTYTGIIPLTDPNSKKVVAFQIVKLVDKAPAGQRELNDPRVQQFIRDHLRESYEQLRKAAFYEVLRNQAKVENYYAELLLQNAK